MLFQPTGVGVGVPVKIFVTSSTAQLLFGQTAQLEVTLMDVTGAVQKPIWPLVYASSNPALATVDDTGLVTAVSPDASLLVPGGTVTLSVGYSYANRPPGSDTMSAEITMTVLGTPSLSRCVPQAPGSDTSVEGACGCGGWGWKAIPTAVVIN